MKKNAKKITLSRETLCDSDAQQVSGGGDTQDTRACPTLMTCGIIQTG
jgi:hypothetical protein